jgi:hypothetical protein
MLKNLSRAQVISVWFAAVALIVAVSVLAGLTAAPGTWAFLLLLSLVPPAVSFVVWQTPPETVHEVLYVARQGRSRT